MTPKKSAAKTNNGPLASLVVESAGPFQYLLRLGDDRLVLGHRLSEWCGHGPILEEDIALANIALDLIGQANLLLAIAGTAEEKGRDQDALVYFREAVDYRNVLIAELPKGDFAFTIARQFVFSVFAYLQLEALQKSTHKELAGIAAKGVKEAKYHVRHSADWVIKLGDGTEESHTRMQDAVNEIWRYTGELFLADDVDRAADAAGVGVDPSKLEQPWRAHVDDVFGRATLTVPEVKFMQRGGRTGKHTEHLGHILSEMQIVARSFPSGQW
jgi:ring-1,2-phenylacetyl-CoA epoxidase subunit PaaC